MSGWERGEVLCDALVHVALSSPLAAKTRGVYIPSFELSAFPEGKDMT